MISRWFLGAVSAAGLAAGFSVSAYGSSTPKSHTAGSSEVEKLYHTELTLGTREQELQFLLKLRGDQVAAAARPVAAASPQVAPPSRPAAPAVRPLASASASASQRSAPAPTTTIEEAPPPPEPEPATTTSTLPPTTTTTVAPTTTTTAPGWDGGDGSGGIDN